jgi:hypothetical protein
LPGAPSATVHRINGDSIWEFEFGSVYNTYSKQYTPTGDWQPFSVADSKALTIAYNNKVSVVHFRRDNPTQNKTTPYEIHMAEFKQVQMETGFVRNIRIKVSPPPITVTPPSAPPRPPATTPVDSQQKTTTEKISVFMDTIESEKMYPFVAENRRYFLRLSSLQYGEPLPYWKALGFEPSTHPDGLYDIPRTSSLFTELMCFFRDGLCDVSFNHTQIFQVPPGRHHFKFDLDIVRIQAVCNQGLLNQYIAKRHSMLRKRGGTDCSCSCGVAKCCKSLHEAYLWHGCGKEAAEKIVQNGFMRDFAFPQLGTAHSSRPINAYGIGCYFSTTSFYPVWGGKQKETDVGDKYMKRDDKGRAYLLLSRVLRGETCYGSSGQVFPAATRLFDGLCESMSNASSFYDNATSFITVIGTGGDSQTYPEFLFTFGKPTDDHT